MKGRSQLVIEPKETIKNLNRIRDVGSDRSSYVRLDKNERTVPFGKDAFEKMMARIRPDLLPMYPDQTPLYKKLADYWELNEGYFLLSNGSDAAIKMIFETYINPGDKVVFLDPTYAMIEVYADMFAANKIKIGYSPDLRLNFEDLAGTITPGTKAAIIANPNQPTGTLLGEAEVEALIDRAEKTNTLLVLDEAYQPFSGQGSAVKYVTRSSCLAVIQTFSKAMGLASIRLGYIISDPKNIDMLYKTKSYADISLFAVQLGGFFLDNHEMVKDYIQSVREGKEYVKKELDPLGIECILGHTNFIHIRMPFKYDVKRIYSEMMKRGYLIRISGSGLPAVLEGCIRITVGPVDQMKEFIIVFKEVLASDQS